MSKITITIEDSPDGKVKVVSNPTAEFLIKKVVAKDDTSADGYALTALLAIKRESNSKKPTNLLIPRRHY